MYCRNHGCILQGDQEGGRMLCRWKDHYRRRIQSFCILCEDDANQSNENLSILTPPTETFFGSCRCAILSFGLHHTIHGHPSHRSDLRI